jgi:hypothetical protein
MRPGGGRGVIGRVSKLIIPALTYLCVGTVIAQVGAVAYLIAAGSFGGGRLYQVLAVAYGVDLHQIEQGQTDRRIQPSSEQVSLEDVINRRAMKGLNLDLREQALRNGLDSLRRMQNLHLVERERYDNLKQAFDARLKQLRKDVDQSAILEVQQTLENIQPKQAKEQLLLMLEEQDAMSSVVAIIKAMPMDRRKKILGEFKTPEEVQQLAEILRHIRLGDPEIPLIDKYQQMVDEFKTDDD